MKFVLFGELTEKLKNCLRNGTERKRVDKSDFGIAKG